MNTNNPTGTTDAQLLNTLHQNLHQIIKIFIAANGPREPINTVQELLKGYKSITDDSTTEQAEMNNKAMAIMEFIDKLSETWVQVEALEKKANRVNK